MGDLFFQLGRKLGQAAIPAAQKTRWAWRLLTGSEEESILAERQMGEVMAREIPLAGPGPGAAADAALLAEICARLTGPLRNKDRRFDTSLVLTGSPDTFSLPGGFIFIDASLLALCGRNIDELAFVIAHEIAHIVRRHTLHRWVTGVGIKVISTLLSRGGAGAWWHQNGTELLRRAYDSDQEREADEFGFRLARAAGYDPAGAFRFFQRLQSLRSAPSGLGEHLTSHPLESQRVSWLQEVMRKLERPAGS